MHTSRAERTETQQISRIRPAYPSEQFHIVPQEQELESTDYVGYFRAFLILGIFVLAAIVGLAIIQSVTMNAVSKNTQLQECVMRINPDPNTNYQLEVYKCMNGN